MTAVSLLSNKGATEIPPVVAPIRVLFADDSAPIRMLARYALSAQRGFAVVAEATNGRDALELFEQHHPDCVVLDVDMPGLSGFEVLDELKRQAPGVPVIMLSGFTDTAATSRAAAAGAVAYLNKGTELVLLGETIRRVTQAASESQPTAKDADPVASQPSAAAVEVMPPSAPEPMGSFETIEAEMKRLEYVVSHDFAEPARVMSGFATLLNGRSADALDDRSRVFLEHIVAGSARLQAMIDDLRTYSRAGRAEPTLSVVDVGARLQAVVAQLRQQVAERGAEVTVGTLPAAVGDPTMVSTILRQVLLNALIFNTSTVPRVRIDGHAADGVATYTVLDNGIGVDPAHCEAVFELCRRLNTREEYPGTGTGLTLCRRLATMQRGTVRLDPGPDGGSLVTLTLPAVNPDSVNEHPGETP